MINLNNPVVIEDRFRVDHLIKSSSALSVYAGHDVTTGVGVVIKLADKSQSSTPSQLQRENRLLQAVRHASVPSVLSCGEHQGINYLVTSLISGQRLDERLAHGALCIEEVLHLGIDLLQTIDELHQAGIVHRDIKPENIILRHVLDDARPTDPTTHPVAMRAVLIDFGFATSVDHARQGDTDVSVGTLLYMSPEQAGVVNAPIDTRADLYSVGVVLFECLCGKTPFSGATVGELLRQQLSVTPILLTHENVRVPPQLESVILKLLSKDPSDRYQTAHGARSDLQAILTSLTAMSSDDISATLVVGAYDQRATLTQSDFVGRQVEFEQLVQQVTERQGEAAQSRLLRFVQIEAISGGGKTRLLDELKSWANKRRHPVYSGVGVTAVAARPFQIFSGVVQDVLRFAKQPQIRQQLVSALAEHRQSLVAIFPELLELFVAADCPEVAIAVGEEDFREEFVEHRTNEALLQLFCNLGTTEHPALVCIDDCQWADPAALRFLAYLNQSQASGAVCIVLAFRAEEVDAQHLLRQLRTARHIELAPLSDREVISLVHSMAGPVPDQACDLVVKHAQGSPFMAAALLHGLVEAAALVSDKGVWRLDLSRGDTVCASYRAGVLLTRRLEFLPDATLQLLSVGAVLGRNFRLSHAAALSLQTPQMAQYVLKPAIARHLVLLRDEADDVCFFSHDKLRESLLDRLKAHEKRAIHEDAARHLQTFATTDPHACFDIAFHYNEAQMAELALPFALDAAEQARQKHALDIAIDQYKIAESGARGQAADIRRNISKSLADVYLLTGNYADADVHLNAALSLADSQVECAEIEGKLGESAFKRGDVVLAARYIEAGLRKLGRRVPKSNFVMAVFAGFELVVQALHTVFSSFFCARRRRQGADNEFHAIRLYSRLAYVYWFMRGKVACFWAHQREMNLAERYPPTLELAQAYSEHGPVMTMVPWFERGIEYTRRSLEIRRELKDVWGQGQALHFMGIALYAASRYEEAIETCQQATKLFARAGDRWEMNTAGYHIAFCYYRLGRLAQAVEKGKQVHVSGSSIGDKQASGMGLGPWAKASDGDIEATVIDREFENRNERDIHTSSELFQVKALRAMRFGDMDQAVEILRQAQALVAKFGVQQEYVAPINPWLLTALRRAIGQLPLHAVKQRRALISQASACQRDALKIAKKYQNNLAHVFREMAWLSIYQGRSRRALRYFLRSLQTAEKHGERYELVQTLRAIGQVQGTHSWHNIAQFDNAAGRAEQLWAEISTGLSQPLSVMPPLVSNTPTLSLADRFDNLLINGKQIVSEKDEASVWVAVESAMAALFHGQVCQVVKLVDGKLPSHVMSRSLAEQAILMRSPVIFSDSVKDVPLSESVIISKARSILCAPIFLRQNPIAVVFVTHPWVGCLFCDDDKHIAAFVATLAGVALENAHGYQEIQQLAAVREQMYRDEKENVRARDAFISVASHELKTPMTALQLYAQSLSKFVNQTSVVDLQALQRKSEAIVRQVTRSNKLIGQLLDVSQMTMSTIKMCWERLDMVELIEEVAAKLSLDEQPKPVIRIHQESSVEGIWDRIRLEQVLTNVIGNAIKYGEKKPIDITVKKNAATAVVAVVDRGIGIASCDQEKIFFRFQRLVSERNYGGFGLGLWIARNIVEQMGGCISVQSNLGTGSAFSIVLPTDSSIGANLHDSNATGGNLWCTT